MHILELHSENIKRLKSITIKPSGTLVLIGGENEQGKSSALDSIFYAFAGKGVICDEPVNRNAKRAKVVCKLGDNDEVTLIVTRTITKTGGGSLTVTNGDGSQKFTSAQTMLNGLVGPISFDPQEFAMRGKTTEGRKWQLNTLKELVGLDFTQLDKDRLAHYQKRTSVNTIVTSLKTQFDSAEHYPDAPKIDTAIPVLVQELKTRQVVNKSIHQNKEKLEKIKESMAALISEKEQLEKKLTTKNREIVVLQQTQDGQQSICDSEELLDEEEITDKMTTAQETNRQISANETRVALADQLKAKKAESQTLTDKIETIDDDKAKQLSNANFPIPGLSFDDNGVLYDDLPFDQAADSARFRVSVAISIAMNPELKIMFIRNGWSLLDTNNKALLCQMAEETGHQIWAEVVGKSDDCSVIIEDGSILIEEEGLAAAEDDEFSDI